MLKIKYLLAISFFVTLAFVAPLSIQAQSVTPGVDENSPSISPLTTPTPILTETPIPSTPTASPISITSPEPTTPDSLQGPISTRLELDKPISLDQFATIQKKQKVNIAIIEGDFSYSGETIHDFFVVSEATKDVVSEYKKWRSSSLKNLDEYKKSQQQQENQTPKSDNKNITVEKVVPVTKPKNVTPNTDGVFSITKITAIDKQDKVKNFKEELDRAKISFKDSSEEISKNSGKTSPDMSPDNGSKDTSGVSALALSSTTYTNRVPNSGTSQIGAISGGSGRIAIQYMKWDKNNFADNEIYEHDLFTDNRDGQSYLDPSDTGVAKDYASAILSSGFAGCYPKVTYASTNWPSEAKPYLDTRFNFTGNLVDVTGWYCESKQIAFTIGAAHAKSFSSKTDYFTQIGSNTPGNSSSDTYTLEAQIGPFKGTEVGKPWCPPYDWTWCAFGYDPSGYIALIPALTSQPGWVMPDKTNHTFTNIPIGSVVPWSYKGIAPSAPSGVSVSNSTTNSQQLNFTDNSSNETGFTVEVKNSSGSWSTLGTINALTNYGSYNVGINGLASGQTYCYRMKANNDAGSSANSNEACGTTQQAGRSEVIVDDRSGDFSRTGSYWWEATAGYNSHMFYTYVNGNTVSSTGEWWPTLAGGNYTVSVYIPNINATTANAKYEIYTTGGTVVRSVNQNNYYNAWVNLGTYNFSTGRTRRVRLTDATGETNFNLRIGYDAIKFTPQ